MTGSLVHFQFTITFHDDTAFLEKARELLALQQEHVELRPRLESVLPPAALPHNEKVAQTLHILQKTYGLVVQDEAATLAALIAGALNRAPVTKFGISLGVNDKTEDKSEVFYLPPTRLLLRRLAEVLKITIYIPSTRSHTQVYQSTQSTEQPRFCIGILHVGNSFEEISTYAPLTCSNWPSGASPQNPPQVAPRLSPDLAQLRTAKRPNQKSGFPNVKMEIAMPALLKEW